MISAVVQNILGGVLRPRISVRQIIDGGHGFKVAMLMALLALLVREICVLLVLGNRSGGGGLQLGVHLQALTEGMISFMLLSALVYGVGRVLGGSGNWQETILAMAWYLLVTSIFVPFALPALIYVAEAVAAAGDGPVEPVDIPGHLLALFAVASGIMIWLFACYIAELHRFARTWNVVAVMLGLAAAFSFVLMALVPSN